jgi:RNA polymerase sigma-70 factor (ECF subfamily)
MTARGSDVLIPFDAVAPARFDAQQLELLYSRLEKPVFNVVYRWLWNTEEARDVTQEAFLKLWSSRDRVDPSSAEPLLFKAALNLASNRLRSRRLKSFLGIGAAEEQPAPLASAPDELEREQRRRSVRKAIDALPAKLKEVVVMCELSGLSYEQIAAALQIPIGTVGSRRSAAIQKLSAALGPLEDA